MEDMKEENLPSLTVKPALWKKAAEITGSVVAQTVCELEKKECIFA